MATRADRVRVVLTPAECALAESVGRLRHENAKTKGCKPSHDLEVDDVTALRLDIRGAYGECIIAKHFGVFWNGTIGQRGDDVKRLRVRMTTKDDGCCIVRTEDPNDRAHVLVVGRKPIFEICGWIWGLDAKRDNWLKPVNGREPAYFVPQVCLAPLVMLPPSEYA